MKVDGLQKHSLQSDKFRKARDFVFRLTKGGARRLGRESAGQAVVAVVAVVADSAFLHLGYHQPSDNIMMSMIFGMFSGGGSLILQE